MSVQAQIEDKLQQALAPSFLNVENESHGHNVPANSETHFKVVVATDQFVGKRAVARHQAIYQLLADELQNGVHALALHTYTPEEWQQQGQKAPLSPKCMGGSKNS